MVGARAIADLRRSCLAALLSQLARGTRDAIADVFGKHSSPDVISALDEFAAAADTLAAFLHSDAVTLPPDATTELFRALRTVGVQLAAALDTRLSSDWHPVTPPGSLHDR